MNEENNTIIEKYLDSAWMEKGLAENSLDSYGRDLKLYAFWLSRHNNSILSAQKADILEFFFVRSKLGISSRSIARLLSCLKGFYQYAFNEKWITTNPTIDITAPKIGRPLPHALTEEEVEALIESPDKDCVLGLRDKAMLELLYACGLRVSELIGLKISDINLMQGVVRVFGKGNKERLIPMGETAIDLLSRYFKNSRLELLNGKVSDICFLSNRGQMMTRQTFWHRIKYHGSNAGITKQLSPHTVRHAFATHLLNHGADLRVVQLLLGHSDLSTTQIYTHVATQRLQDLHAKHHPRG